MNQPVGRNKTARAWRRAGGSGIRSHDAGNAGSCLRSNRLIPAYKPRRSALVTTAVTGQIDLREVA
jgi:hypothetical protein